MHHKNLNIVKRSGEKVKYSFKKLKASLRHSGATEEIIDRIVKKMNDELYEGISTKEIFNRAFHLLKREKGTFASKYKLKKAIYELGPSGFPFENFTSAILKYSGYQTTVGKVLQGKCVKHEIDVLASKNNTNVIVECKFHGDQGQNCNVKVPLYIYSRFIDVKSHWDQHNTIQLDSAWVVTNTRFTEDAINYGNCIGLYLLSWDYPAGNSIKDRINRLGLYPITVSTLLTKREKAFLLEREIILCRQLVENSFFLNYVGVSEIRKKKILSEMHLMCKG